MINVNEITTSSSVKPRRPCRIDTQLGTPFSAQLESPLIAPFGTPDEHRRDSRHRPLTSKRIRNGNESFEFIIITADYPPDRPPGRRPPGRGEFPL
ncbi:MAG: hypothetical protein FWC56_02295, partial [Phycisphaerae bacterium]|nr:hypothetical protein [Phycisphaerae bacterium]